MSEIDLDIETAQVARRAVGKIVDTGDHGAVRVSVEEIVAMARAIRVLVAKVDQMADERVRLIEKIEQRGGRHAE